MLELDHCFAERSLDIVFVQEGRLQQDGDHSCCNYRMLRSGATPAGGAGVQIWLLHKLAKFITATIPVSPRILRVVLTAGPFEIHLVAAHAPIDDSPPDEIHAFLGFTSRGPSQVHR